MNPVEIEIFNHLFQSIAEEMGAVLMRAAFSPNIKERRDHSCAVFDSTGSLLSQAAHIPVHLGSMPMSVRSAIDAVPMTRGVSVILNDPYDGGTHLPDVTLVTPVFGESAEPCFYVANRAHHADVGGIVPGSLPLSRTIADEGFRIGPTRFTPELAERFAMASRIPDDRRGDLAAQTAANRLGVERLEALIDRYGHRQLLQRGRDLQAYAGRLMGSVIAAIPDGEYTAVDRMDGDGFEHRDVRIELTLKVTGDRCSLDFRGTDDQVPGPINAVRAIAVSAVFYVFRCLGPSEMPTNAGCLEPVEIITRPGSLLDALPPAPVAAGNVETSQRIVDVILRALSEAIPDRIPAASSGSMNNLAMGSTGGDRPFVYYETIAGGTGAGPGWDGASGIQTHMTNTLNTPIEALEHAFPIRLHAVHLRDGSGGKGRYRGGLGVVREVGFLEETEVTVISERQSRGPYGLAGGEPGMPGRTLLIDVDGTETVLPAKITIVCQPGQRLRIETAGGGGWGEMG
jgi:N-methylhydantoinase B